MRKSADDLHERMAAIANDADMELISLYVSDELPLEDRQACEELMENDPEFRERAERIMLVWSRGDRLTVSDKDQRWLAQFADLPPHARRETLVARRRTVVRSRWLRAASIAGVAVVTGGAYLVEVGPGGVHGNSPSTTASATAPRAVASARPAAQSGARGGAARPAARDSADVARRSAVDRSSQIPTVSAVPPVRSVKEASVPRQSVAIIPPHDVAALPVNAGVCDSTDAEREVAAALARDTASAARGSGSLGTALSTLVEQARAALARRVARMGPAALPHGIPTAPDSAAAHDTVQAQAPVIVPKACGTTGAKAKAP